ncbi:MAG TPA: hypothetical protein VGZ29_06265 [Terriglobia bacterium]|nr:hypothetical protein [Terriglobia bacterium]
MAIVGQGHHQESKASKAIGLKAREISKITKNSRSPKPLSLFLFISAAYLEKWPFFPNKRIDRKLLPWRVKAQLVVNGPRFLEPAFKERERSRNVIDCAEDGILSVRTRITPVERRFLKNPIPLCKVKLEGRSGEEQRSGSGEVGEDAKSRRARRGIREEE